MEFHLNETKVREMASRMRKVLGNDALGYGKSLEAVAQTLGYLNWDTLSGLLKRDGQDKFVLANPVILYVGAFACDSWGESPSWARLSIDQDFLDAVLGMQALCLTKGLAETSRSWSVEVWDQDERLRMQGDDLIVGANSWWIKSCPKHVDYNCETRMMDIAWLLAALKKAEGPGAGYLAWRKDILVYDTSGNITGLVEELVDAGELNESYLDV